jgi:hypothetical protein
LSDGDERDAVRVEKLDQLGEVGERSGEPVDFVDDDNIDTPLALGARMSLARRNRLLARQSGPGRCWSASMAASFIASLPCRMASNGGDRRSAACPL